MRSIKLFLTLIFIAPAGHAQSLDIEKLILWERSYHTYADVSKLHLMLNSGSELDHYLRSDLSDYFGGNFQLSYNNYTNADFDNVGFSYAKIRLQVGAVNSLLILNAPKQIIEQSRLLHVMTAFEGLFGAFELGIPFVDNTNNSWTYYPEKLKTGAIFQQEIYSDVCSSFYFVHPSESTRKPRGISATFFIESGPQSRSCFNNLLLDAIGLRGLAIRLDVNPQEVIDSINALKTYENGQVFQIGN